MCVCGECLFFVVVLRKNSVELGGGATTQSVYVNRVCWLVSRVGGRRMLPLARLGREVPPDRGQAW